MAASSKNAYINKLPEIVNEYDKTFHSTIKIKSAVANSDIVLKYKPNVLQYATMKHSSTFSQKDQIGPKKRLKLRKLEIQRRGLLLKVFIQI